MNISLIDEAKLYPNGTILRRGDGDIYEVQDGFPYYLETRKGDWIQVQDGKVAYVQDLRQDEIEIAGIAHSLSMQCRWNGWIREFFSVCQHSVYVGIRAGQIAVAQGMPPEFVIKCRKAGLMHDVGEAYLGDLITPVKKFMPLFYEMEHDVVTKVDRKYPFYYGDKDIQKIVKQADMELLFIERDALLTEPGDTSDPYGCEQHNTGLTFFDLNPTHYCWPPEAGKEFFIDYFEELYNDSK